MFPADADCADVAQAIYGFPTGLDIATMYALGFGFVFIPWLISWSLGRIITAIRLIPH